MSDVLILERPASDIVLIRLHRPAARNALNDALRDGLIDALDSAEHDANIRCVVITGSDDFFCAGADVKEFANDTPESLRERKADRLWKATAVFTKPIVVAIEGLALGGGCELALAADIIVVAEDATLGQPEIRLGIMPGGGATQRLLRAVGFYKTQKLLMTGEFITGSEAHAMGFASEVVAKGKALGRALDIAKRICTYSPLAIAAIKKVVREGLDLPLAEGLKNERRTFEALFGTQDAKEGIAAFLEKRPAKFRGR